MGGRAEERQAGARARADRPPTEDVRVPETEPLPLSSPLPRWAMAAPSRPCLGAPAASCGCGCCSCICSSRHSLCAAAAAITASDVSGPVSEIGPVDAFRGGLTAPNTSPCALIARLLRSCSDLRNCLRGLICSWRFLAARWKGSGGGRGVFERHRVLVWANCWWARRREACVILKRASLWWNECDAHLQQNLNHPRRKDGRLWEEEVQHVDVRRVVQAPESSSILTQRHVMAPSSCNAVTNAMRACAIREAAHVYKERQRSEFLAAERVPVELLDNLENT